MEESMALAYVDSPESMYDSTGSPDYPDTQTHWNLVMEDEKLLALAKTVHFTPLIKEELKLKIQERRQAMGKGELELCETKPKIHELSSDDIRKRELRKEQNRRAARKYRVKQRAKTSIFHMEMDQLEVDNCLLRDEIRQLNKEKNELADILHQHLQQCACGVLDQSFNLPSSLYDID